MLVKLILHYVNIVLKKFHPHTKQNSKKRDKNNYYNAYNLWLLCIRRNQENKIVRVCCSCKRLSNWNYLSHYWITQYWLLVILPKRGFKVMN